MLCGFFLLTADWSGGSTKQMPDHNMTQMKIEEWSIDRPIPYARNARQIPQSAIDKVAASISEFGWRQPIVVDEHDVIIAGHTRLLAARKLGLATVPVHVARGAHARASQSAAADGQS
jgi:ParB-like chromosome segregation protein Spo0J